MKTNLQMGVPKNSRVHRATCGVRVRFGRRGGNVPKPMFEKEFKLESVTLARLAALGI